jgi:VanZ family protein
MKSLLTRWLPLSLWVIIIIIMSSIPDIFTNLPTVWYTRIIYVKALDSNLKLYEIVGALSHLGEYMLLAVLLTRALIGRGKVRNSLLPAAFTLSVLFAYFNEIFQTGIPGRGFEWIDLMIDAIGSLFGIFIFVVLQKWLNEKKSRPVDQR